MDGWLFAPGRPAVLRLLWLLEHALDGAECLFGCRLRLISRESPLETSESTFQQITARTVCVDEVCDRSGAVHRGSCRRDREGPVVVVARVQLLLRDDRPIGLR